MPEWRSQPAALLLCEVGLRAGGQEERREAIQSRVAAGAGRWEQCGVESVRAEAEPAAAGERPGLSERQEAPGEWAPVRVASHDVPCAWHRARHVINIC